MILYVALSTRQDIKKNHPSKVVVVFRLREPGLVGVKMDSGYGYLEPSQSLQLSTDVGMSRAPWDFIAPVRTIMGDPRERYQPLLRTWLTECCTNHKECPNLDSVLLPTRVLDVGGQASSYISLHVSRKGELGRYMALSYCWGNGNPVKTTAGNIAEHRQGIAFDGLPKTI
ncbi:hypothetical protein B0H63DRAFT_219313 [Podospora didyma]|uniref:Heterokaryon incompatibility domain-containing protein n=1 Tax=Podospora didyma TaxID=330526 RepID=A0AAE0KIU0_9PEZI|nr:hypothetical protein B0H63DRAFT_219313 [Podospora didyma]